MREWLVDTGLFAALLALAGLIRNSAASWEDPGGKMRASLTLKDLSITLFLSLAVASYLDADLAQIIWGTWIPTAALIVGLLGLVITIYAVWHDRLGGWAWLIPFLGGTVVFLSSDWLRRILHG